MFGERLISKITSLKDIDSRKYYNKLTFEGFDGVDYTMIVANISLKIERYYQGPNIQDRIKNLSIGLIFDSEITDKQI